MLKEVINEVLKEIGEVACNGLQLSGSLPIIRKDKGKNDGKKNCCGKEKSNLR